MAWKEGARVRSLCRGYYHGKKWHWVTVGVLCGTGAPEGRHKQHVAWAQERDAATGACKRWPGRGVWALKVRHGVKIVWVRNREGVQTVEGLCGRKKEYAPPAHYLQVHCSPASGVVAVSVEREFVTHTAWQRYCRRFHLCSSSSLLHTSHIRS